MNQIQSERLYLKPVAVTDVDFIMELQNSPKWLKYIGDRKLRTKADTVAYIEDKMLSHFKKHGYGNYVVCKKETHQKLGTCGIFNRAGMETCDIGFALLPKFEGLGYGFESASVLLECAKTNFKLEKIGAIVLPENRASIKLIEKLGLQYVKKVILPDDDEVLDYYELSWGK